MGLIKPRVAEIKNIVTTGQFVTTPEMASTELLIPVKIDVAELAAVFGVLVGASDGNSDITAFTLIYNTAGYWVSHEHTQDGNYWTGEHYIFNNSQGLVVVGFDAGQFDYLKQYYVTLVKR